VTARTLATAALLALAAPIATAHADNRDYVDSGQYLADVTAAAAPASDWLLARTDTIARQAELCRAAGFPLGGATLAPAATDTGSGASRVASTVGDVGEGAAAAGGGVARRGVVARAAASRGATASGAAGSSGAIASGPAAGTSGGVSVGSATLTFDRASVLSRAKAAVRAVAPASAKGRAYTLPVAQGKTVGLAGALRLVRGQRAVTIKDIRLDVGKTSGKVVGAVGGKRVTVFTIAVPRSGSGVPVMLTKTAAQALGKALKTTVRPGRVGTLALKANARQVVPGQPVAGASAPAAAPLGGAPSGSAPVAGEPGLTVVPASPEACAATPAHPALVLDLDETALSNYIDTWGDPNSGDIGQAGPAAFGQSTAMAPILDIYKKARARGVAVFFITARPGIIEAATRDNLQRVGYTAYEGLSFKNDLAAAKDAYKSAERAAVEARGYRIILNVGDQQTDLDGGHAERAFKLPNPFY
jgi:hypothetical protein